MKSSNDYRLIDETVGVEDCDSRLLYGREVSAGDQKRSASTQVAFQRIDTDDRRVFGVLKRIYERMI